MGEQQMIAPDLLQELWQELSIARVASTLEQTVQLLSELQLAVSSGLDSLTVENVQRATFNF